tara:strand:- start:65 stop:397 length:333 start_codon:yes stop_codon:yes gene_type:complete
MNWKQMLEVKPEVETAVDVMTSGDPCCETARDKMIETLKNFVATFPNKIKRPDELELFIREIDCEDLDILMDQIIENSRNDVSEIKSFALEIREIRNEWIECDNTDELFT